MCRPIDTEYCERAQSADLPVSAYGCHREVPWTDALRSPRNPGPGLGGKEMKYCQQHPPTTAVPAGVGVGKLVNLKYHGTTRPL